MIARRLLPLAFAVSLGLVSSRARAECVESVPSGVERPQMQETFPPRGLSGYAATLHVIVTHGQGETVLPHGLGLQRDSESARDIKSAGFELPDAVAGAGPQLSRLPVDPKTGRGQTIVDLPLLALPSGPGRHLLKLPPLPIAIARASGEVVTLCTKPHALVVDDPTASTPEAKPRPNPAPRLQREEWVALKRALGWGALGVAVGSALAWVIYLWLNRPRALPPAPPPRVPWEVALERLHEVRHAGLLETSRFAEFFDRVNDAVREYLGARYGFEGLESTTDETLAALTRLRYFALPLPELAGFLQQCDLVKFADVTPTLEECQHALAEAERVVRVTTPIAREGVSGAGAEVRP
jgi:hypothetical protein